MVLHGSTTLGVDDAFSDLDVWVLVPAATLERVDRKARTRFFEFKLGGKAGHFNFEDAQLFGDGIERCDFPRIYELRHAVPIADPDGAGAALIQKARQPMRDEVKRAWLRYHYVEMRSEHKCSQNPTERGDALALAFSLSDALEHALRCALILDDLSRILIRSGSLMRPCKLRPDCGIKPSADASLDLLASNALRRGGPQSDHPLNGKLREVRQVLIDEAKVQGIDGPWLNQWWLHLDEAQDGIRGIRW